MAVNTDEKMIDQLLSLGVADVIVKEDLKKKLRSGKILRIKLGIDPTGFDLHLGHMVVLHKLKEFQDLGHQIILLFGNFTGRIGDPSGKNETRPMRTQEELEANAKDYMEQAGKILDVSKVEVRWNAEWLAPLNFADVVTLASQFTVAQMLERDMFQDRIKANQPISVHEFMYPLMQGYDSVALKADVELGGTDQTFNLLAGRTLQKAYGQEPQNILTVPILIGTDGSMKMGKSTGNYIAVAETPEDMYGKTMSISDELILNYFELAARVDGDELAEFKKRLEEGENPRNLKMELAHAIVELYHGEKAAQMAEEHFKTVHQKREVPEEVEEVTLGAGSGANGAWNIVDLISELGLAETKSKARQLIEGGAVKWEGEKVEDVKMEVTLTGDGALLQVGKRNFRRVKN
ncbi:MAG: tyrosine--tRNA ligase [Candidatus Gracilibacteria bacterium]|jgi:tyrosyl-tRNA synthetase